MIMGPFHGHEGSLRCRALARRTALAQPRRRPRLLRWTGVFFRFTDGRRGLLDGGRRARRAREDRKCRMVPPPPRGRRGGSGERRDERAWLRRRPRAARDLETGAATSADGWDAWPRARHRRDRAARRHRGRRQPGEFRRSARHIHGRAQMRTPCHFGPTDRRRERDRKSAESLASPLPLRSPGVAAKRRTPQNGIARRVNSSRRRRPAAEGDRKSLNLA